MTPQARITNLNRSQAARLSLILALSLLFAQWLGLTHAVTHANFNSGIAVEQTEFSFVSGFDHQKSASICSLLDAATLAAALHTPAVVAPIFAALPLHDYTASGSSWTEPFRLFFSSRAPPLLT